MLSYDLNVSLVVRNDAARKKKCQCKIIMVLDTKQAIFFFKKFLQVFV